MIFLAGVSSVSARLGETPEECKKRYNDPVSVEREAGGIYMEFKSHGVLIDMLFYEGKCIYILYTREDEPELTQKQIEGFLKTNESGGAWKKVEGNDQFEEWDSGDKMREASLRLNLEGGLTGALSISDIAANQAFEKAKE